MKIKFSSDDDIQIEAKIKQKPQKRAPETAQNSRNSPARPHQLHSPQNNSRPTKRSRKTSEPIRQVKKENITPPPKSPSRGQGLKFFCRNLSTIIAFFEKLYISQTRFYKSEQFEMSTMIARFLIKRKFS